MFNKNIEAVKKTNPDLAKKLLKVTLNDAQNEVSALETESDDFIIAYNNIPLDSEKDPIEDSLANWQANVDEELSKNDIVIIFGFGLGYLFKRAYISSPAKIFIYEPKINILRFVLEYVDFSEQLADERVYLTDNDKDFIDKLTEKYITNDKIKFIYPPGYIKIAAEELKLLSSKIVEACQSKKSDISTIGKLSKLWVENCLENTKHLSDSRPLNVLKDKFKGLTALVIGAGPSLRTNIELIKQNRNKYVIFAVNKIIEYLIQNGITPDFLVTSDAQWVEKTIKPIGQATPEINLIPTTKTDSSIYNFKFKRIFNYYQKNNAFDEELNKLFPKGIELYETEGLVTSQCYYSALEMGFKNIIFCGLDLAMKENLAYADGGEIKEIGDKIALVSDEHRKIAEVKSVTGAMVTTRDDYELFAKQLEKAFSDNTNAILYNTTDFGAYIEGMTYEPFEKIIKNMPELNIDIDKKLSDIYVETKENWTKIHEKQSNILSSQKQDLENINSQIKNFLDQNKELIESMDKTDKNIIPIISQIKNKELDIIKQIMANIILSSYFQMEVLNYTELYRDNDIETEITIRKQALEMFELMILQIKSLIEKLK